MLLDKVRLAFGLLRAVGLKSSGNIALRRYMRIGKAVAVKVGGRRLFVRPLDSDMFVLVQIFGLGEYQLLPTQEAHLRERAGKWREMGYTPVIIDAGANVGYSTVHFATTFPEATVLAIEPCRYNFQQLKTNTKSYDNIDGFHAALWSHTEGVELFREPQRSWSSVVVEGVGTPSITLHDVLKTVQNPKILVIKLDVEGAEKVICSSAPDLIGDAECIIVEPHDFKWPGLGSLSPLYAAIAGRAIDTTINGENLILCRTPQAVQVNRTAEVQSSAFIAP